MAYKKLNKKIWEEKATIVTTRKHYSSNKRHFDPCIENSLVKEKGLTYIARAK